jgi:hypothetical protein
MGTFTSYSLPAFLAHSVFGQKAAVPTMLEDRVEPNPDAQHIKALLTQQLTRTTLLLYQLDWVLLQNRSEAPFITSDNPSSVFPRRLFSNNLVRFLPLAPDFALLTVIDPTIKRPAELPDFEKAPPGRVRRAGVTRKQAARLNRVTVMNADELVLSVGASSPVRRLVHNHRDFRVVIEHARFSTPDGGYINGSSVVVRRERSAAMDRITPARSRSTAKC